MTVKQLKAIIKDLPDDARLLAPAADHSYREVDAAASTALFDTASHDWTEDYGEDETPEAEYGERCQVVVIQ